MKRQHLLLVSALLAAVPACDVLGPTHRTLLVQHYRAECVGVGLGLCLLVREPGQPDFLYSHTGIEGFVYQWGYTYRIEVEEHTVSPVEADGSSIRQVLRSVVSKERVPAGTAFDLFLTGGEGRVVEVGDDLYQFYSSAQFVCPAGTRCSDLRAQIAAGARIEYRLAHPAAPEEPLVVVDWQLCDQRLAGSGICQE